MSERTRLPNRRECARYEFTLNGFKYKGVIGFRPDGAPAEIFLEAGRVGSEVQAVARDAAILASLALQRGATVDDLRHSLTRLENNQPAGPVAKLLDLHAQEASA